MLRDIQKEARTMGFDYGLIMLCEVTFTVKVNIKRYKCLGKR